MPLTQPKTEKKVLVLSLVTTCTAYTDKHTGIRCHVKCCIANKGNAGKENEI